MHRRALLFYFIIFCIVHSGHFCKNCWHSQESVTQFLPCSPLVTKQWESGLWWTGTHLDQCLLLVRNQNPFLRRNSAYPQSTKHRNQKNTAEKQQWTVSNDSPTMPKPRLFCEPWSLKPRFTKIKERVGRGTCKPAEKHWVGYGMSGSLCYGKLRPLAHLLTKYVSNTMLSKPSIRLCGKYINVTL